MRRIIGNQFGTQFVGSGIVPERFVIASAVTQGPSKGEMEQKPVEIICRHGQRIPDGLDVIDLQPDRPETRETPPCLTVSRSEEHTSELQSLMRTSYAVFCLKKKTKQHRQTTQRSITTEI